MRKFVPSHKQIRLQRRKKWKKILKTKELTQDYFIKPKGYQKLKKYEQRKRRNRSSRVVANHLSDIELHSKIDFDENISSVFSVTKQIDKYLFSHLKGNFRVNHRDLKAVSLDGLLYLVSQISKIKKVKEKESSKRKLKYNKHLGLKSASQELKYLFYTIGYWDYFGIKKPYSISQDIKENYFLSIESNTKSDFDLLNKIKKFVKSKVSMFDDYALEYKFDDAIKEAMGNAVEHAYTDDFAAIGKDKGRWWICGHYDNVSKSLQIIFYDYGIGIRESIAKNMGEEAKRYLLDKLSEHFIKSDADLIEMAIEGKLSKYKNYKEHDRGKGFKRFQDFAKSSGMDCELQIVSGKGKYTFNFDKIMKNENVAKRNLDDKIDGMLIKWTIKVGEKDG